MDLGLVEPTGRWFSVTSEAANRPRLTWEGAVARQWCPLLTVIPANVGDHLSSVAIPAGIPALLALRARSSGQLRCSLAALTVAAMTVLSLVS